MLCARSAQSGDLIMSWFWGVLVTDGFGTDSKAVNECLPSMWRQKEAGNPMHVDDALTMLGLVHASIGKGRYTARNRV
jgi:hypothetical protein